MPGTSKRATSKSKPKPRQGCRPAARKGRRKGARQAHRVSWSRRIGVALALLLMIGAGIAFASTAIDTGDRRAQPTATVPQPPPAPALVAPDVPLTGSEAVDIDGSLPPGLDRRTTSGLRLYLNGELVRERDVPATDTFTVRSLPLTEGDNEFTATLVGTGGESAPSVPVSIERDSTAPRIRVAAPDADATVYGPTVKLRGRTEAGASMAVTEELTGRQLNTALSGDGRFETTLHLEVGSNTFVLDSVDPVGNRSSARFAVVRAVSLGAVNLSLSVSELALADLPATVRATATVRDEFGDEAQDVPVTFSLSPPNRGTTTYQAATRDGHASWPNMVVTGDGRASGQWLVTVLATLPSGEELRGDASFTVR